MQRKNKFMEIKSKKVRYNYCDLSIYFVNIHILILRKKIFYNNLSKRAVIFI